MVYFTNAHLQHSAILTSFKIKPRLLQPTSSLHPMLMLSVCCSVSMSHDYVILSTTSLYLTAVLALICCTAAWLMLSSITHSTTSHRSFSHLYTQCSFTFRVNLTQVLTSSYIIAWAHILKYSICTFSCNTHTSRKRTPP